MYKSKLSLWHKYSYFHQKCSTTIFCRQERRILFGKNLPIYTFEIKCLETDIPEYNEKTHKIFFNTTADLKNLPQDMKNMLEYINSGNANDEATKAIDNEVKEAMVLLAKPNEVPSFKGTE